MKYIIRIVLILIVAGILTQGLYALLSKGQSTYRNDYKKYREMFADSSKYDAVIFGSSRAYKNIDPLICDSLTGLSFYNAGVSGAKFYEISMIFSAYFEAHPSAPRFIIYNLDELNFSTDKKFFNPTLYFDFFCNSKIYNGFKGKQYPVWLYKNIPFTRILEYNDDSRNDALKGFFGHVNPEDITQKGYSKMVIDELKTMKKNAAGSIKLGTYKNNSCFDVIINFCSKNNVKIIFTISPVYNNYYKNKITNYDDLVNDFQKYANDHNYPFWRFDTIPICNDSRHFTDDVHLNKSGTDVFTTLLAKKISEYLVQNK